jgi:hypothetical protein
MLALRGALQVMGGFLCGLRWVRMLAKVGISGKYVKNFPLLRLASEKKKTIGYQWDNYHFAMAPVVFPFRRVFAMGKKRRHLKAP